MLTFPVESQNCLYKMINYLKTRDVTISDQDEVQAANLFIYFELVSGLILFSLYPLLSVVFLQYASRRWPTACIKTS